MSAGTQIHGWREPSRRRVPRFRLQEPLNVTVLRSGISDSVPGRSVDVCERGIAAVLAGDLVPGENVGVEVRLAAGTELLRTQATVRYQDRLKYGLEFAAIAPEQRSAIRQWAKSLEDKSGAALQADTIKAPPPAPRKEKHSLGTGGGTGRNTKRARTGWIIILLAALIIAGLLWWKWNRDWEALETGSERNGSASKPVQVPIETMQKLLVHKVDPAYPLEARKANLQGIIALDIVVGTDGSVLSIHALNGPPLLANAAMDALRWWKFEPYRVNGAPVPAETTVAVEFKP